MIFRLCLGQALLVALVHCAAVTNVKKDPETGEARIVNGSACPIKDHPYMVDICYTESMSHHCGGSLISPYFILTAGHCCRKNYVAGYFTALVGRAAGRPEVDRTGVNPLSQIIVANYRHNVADVGLMRMKSSIPEAAGVSYIPLAKVEHTVGEDLLQVCKNAVVIGYGMQFGEDIFGQLMRTPTPPYDPRLQCVRLPVISLDECQRRNRERQPYQHYHMCAYAEGQDICHGDSGGPLICNNVQYGLISGGYGCAYRQFAGVYMRVDHFEDWIEDIIEKEPSEPRSSATARCENNMILIMLTVLVTSGCTQSGLNVLQHL